MFFSNFCHNYHQNYQNYHHNYHWNHHYHHQKKIRSYAQNVFFDVQKRGPSCPKENVFFLLMSSLSIITYFAFIGYTYNHLNWGLHWSANHEMLLKSMDLTDVGQVQWCFLSHKYVLCGQRALYLKIWRHWPASNQIPQIFRLSGDFLSEMDKFVWIIAYWTYKLMVASIH